MDHPVCLCGFCLVVIFTHPFVTKPGKVMHHNDLGCGAKKNCLQGEGHTDSECLCNGNVTVSTRASELMIFFANKHTVMADHHKPKCRLKILDCCV